MQSTDIPFLVPHMSNDPRVRIFRRIFAPETAEQMEVDAFVMYYSGCYNRRTSPFL